MNPAGLPTQMFITNPKDINMNFYDPYSMKITNITRIPDEFIQKYPKKFLIDDVQKIHFMLKNQKMHVKSLQAILDIYEKNHRHHLFFSIIKLSELEGELDNFIEKYHNKILWTYQNVSCLSEEQKIKYKDIINWKCLQYTKDLSKKIIEKCLDKLDKQRLIECSNYIDRKLPDYLDKEYLEKMIN